MAKVLHLHTHRDRYDITIEKLEEYLEFMIRENLIYVEDCSISGNTLDGYFKLGYEIDSEEDEMFLHIDITRSNVYGKWENFEMYGFPKCFDRLDIDLVRLFNFFNEGGWDFSFNCEYETEYETDDYDNSYYKLSDMEIVGFKMDSAYSETSSYITVDDDYRKLYLFELLPFLKKETVNGLVNYLWDYFYDHLIENIDM